MCSSEVKDDDQARMAPDRTLGWSQQRTRFGGFFVVWRSAAFWLARRGIAKGLHGLLSAGHVRPGVGCVIYLHQPRRMCSLEVKDDDQARMAPDRTLGWSQQRTRFGGFFVVRCSAALWLARRGIAKGLHGLLSAGPVRPGVGCVIYLHQPRRMCSSEVKDDDQARMAPDRTLGWSQQRTRFGGFFVFPACFLPWTHSPDSGSLGQKASKKTLSAAERFSGCQASANSMRGAPSPRDLATSPGGQSARV